MMAPLCNSSTRRRRTPLLLAAAATATVVLTGSTTTAFVSRRGNHGHTLASSRAVVKMKSDTTSGSYLPRTVLLTSTNNKNGKTVKKGGRLLSTDDESPPPGSPLRSICDDENEFKMAVGKAIDTLRKDYPDILTKCPNWEIYDKNIEVVDPSGVTLHGTRNYKTSFQFMHALVNFFYCPADSSLTFRLMYDNLRNSIRVSWNAVLVPRAIYGGVRNLLHVDGISVYDFDRKTGLIYKHHIEHLLLNGEPQKPVEGVFSAIKNQAVSDGIPVYTVPHPDGVFASANNKQHSSNINPFTVEFNAGKRTLTNLLSTTSTSLFSMSETSSDDMSSLQNNNNFDEDAYNKKNVYRKKFGLKPLSIAEFKEIQAQIRQMEAEQQAKAASAAAAAAELAKREKGKKNALSSLFGGILEDTCESNFDCERPEICCDFGFKKMCCSSGMKVFGGALSPQQQMQLVRVPAPSGDEGEFPRGGPGGMGDGPMSGY